ncbi:MAG: hypothetical protein H0W40_03750 [Methylibium sp.]|uniref:hypothetical protein n=1 Tax=Methylibium sp. TaxID=2067992 RepID=UPI001840CE15|nr:hypothetical protein [Methylibium sp.]MBA3596475.1 hypothetical protein [Methylibium sp.]
MTYPTSHVRIFNTPTRPVRVLNAAEFYAALDAGLKELRAENAADCARLDKVAADLASTVPQQHRVLNALAEYHSLIRVARGNGTQAARLQRLYGAN